MSDTQATSVSGAPKRSNVLVFPNETSTPTAGPDKSTQALDLTELSQVRGANALLVIIDTGRLYDAPAGDSSNIVRALELLKKVSDYFSAARKANSVIDADRSLQRAQKALPSLFALRSIGDGFGLIVNALYVAFANLHGKPMNNAQIEVAWRVVRELRTRPALSLEQGLQAVEELEESGLAVDPPELATLIEGSESAEDD
jgi:hypothetical protein